MIKEELIKELYNLEVEIDYFKKLKLDRSTLQRLINKKLKLEKKLLEIGG